MQLGPTAENDQGWSERESFAQMYRDRSAELEAAERNLCFGRLDFGKSLGKDADGSAGTDHAGTGTDPAGTDEDQGPGDMFYIGRLGLRSDDHAQLLVDWRARAAEPFYRATPRERYGVTRRRHLHTAGRRVVRLDDDVLDLDAVDEAHLTGEAALLASLRQGRTGRMGDIVATIQADQDRIIRDDPGGILVVEGGPGTGKTVVALHRAAYLLYTHRKRLARRGILVIGPNPAFLRYIDQVLPSLGENDVVLATVGSLFPGVDARGAEHRGPRGSRATSSMADVLAKAVAGAAPGAGRRHRDQGRRHHLPAHAPHLPPGPRRSASRTAIPTRAPAAAQHGPAGIHQRGSAGPDPAARARARRPAEPAPGDEEESARRAGRRTPPCTRVLDVLWPESPPRAAARAALRRPGRLDLTDGERAAIARDTPGRGPAADVPLLDELAELLGPGLGSRRRARRRTPRTRPSAPRSSQYARASSCAKLHAEDDASSCRELELDDVRVLDRRRNIDGEAARRARRAGVARPDLGLRARDRRRGAGAVRDGLADGAAPLPGPLDDRRRRPGADRHSRPAPTPRAQVLTRSPRRWRTARLTVNYRTPAPVMGLAAALLPPAVGRR